MISSNQASTIWWGMTVVIMVVFFIANRSGKVAAHKHLKEMGVKPNLQATAPVPAAQAAPRRPSLLWLATLGIVRITAKAVKWTAPRVVRGAIISYRWMAPKAAKVLRIGYGAIATQVAKAAARKAAANAPKPVATPVTSNVDWSLYDRPSYTADAKRRRRVEKAAVHHQIH